MVDLAAGIPLVLALAGRSPMLPRPAPQDSPSRPQYTAGIELVQLNVVVTDQRGRLVRGLSQSEFVVLEDGVPQSLAFFGNQDVPLDLTLLIDTSSSMRARLPTVRKAAAGFLRTLRPGDTGSVVTFNESVHIVAPPTGDVAALLASLYGLRAVGNTSLYSAVYVVLQGLTAKSSPSSEPRRSAVVLLTDGADTRSVIAFADLLNLARRANVAVYPISLASTPFTGQPGDPAAASGRFLELPDRALAELARETGARSFFPRVIDDLAAVYAEIARELSTQYSLAYETTRRTGPPTYRGLSVRLPAHPEARLRTRAGFITGAADVVTPQSGRDKNAPASVPAERRFSVLPSVFK